MQRALLVVAGLAAASGCGRNGLLAGADAATDGGNGGRTEVGQGALDAPALPDLAAPPDEGHVDAPVVDGPGAADARDAGRADAADGRGDAAEAGDAPGEPPLALMGRSYVVTTALTYVGGSYYGQWPSGTQTFTMRIEPDGTVIAGHRGAVASTSHDIVVE